jgi:uncharacterized protein (TIGR03067 family)
MLRNTMFVLFALVIALAVSAGALPSAEAAPVPKHLMPEAVNPDLPLLQGKWEMTGEKYEGRQVHYFYPKSAGRTKETLEFQSNKVISTFTYTVTVKLDLNARPRRMIFTKGSGDWATTNTWIYKIEGGELIMASSFRAKGSNGEELPSDFESKAGSSATVRTFKRAKVWD